MTNGLIYTPLTQSVFNAETSPSTELPLRDESYLSDLMGSDDGTNLVVEEVKPWNIQSLDQPEDFNWNRPRPASYVAIDVNPGGKVYHTKEREQFKSDLYGAYMRVLKKKGLDEGQADQYAKRLVAQDALESNWGRSGLSKWNNFGGIKDFRTNVDSVKVDTIEYENGQRKTKIQPFRKFATIDDYAKYKIDLLGNNNYKVFDYDPKELYSRLVNAKRKYATDPRYEWKLNYIYNSLWT